MRKINNSDKDISCQEREKHEHEFSVHEEELLMQNEELRRIQAELKRSRDKYTDLYNFSPVGYITIDLSNSIVEANLTAYEIFGTSRNAFIAKPFTSYIFREDWDKFYPLKQTVLEKPGRYSTDIRLLRHENNVFDAHLEIMPVKTAEDQYNSFRIIINDISALKRAEEEAAKAANELKMRMTAHNSQLRSLAMELSHAEQRERRRIAGILHDNLQQLLVGIKLTIQTCFGLTSDYKMMEPLKRVAELIDNSIQVSKSLVLELSPPVLHEGGLVPAVNWLCLWMKEKFGLSVDVQADIDVKPDPEGLYVQLFEFIRELLLNVVKHSGTNSAQVFIRPRNGKLQITVSDKGSGFKYGELDHADTGFGLFSIRERMTLLGGEISIESAPGEGTRVTILAPLTHVLVPKLREEAVSLRVSGSAAGRENGGSGRPGIIRVLIVDDHKIVREGLSMLLSSVKDIEVVGEALDGAEAVAMTRKINPDIVIMDISMPGMNGIEATKIITSEFPGITVIGLSMLEEAGSSKDLLNAGAADYIHKACASDELIASVRNHAKQLKGTGTENYQRV